jgi:hypothetical protein
MSSTVLYVIIYSKQNNMLKNFLGIFAIAQIVVASVLLSPDLFMRVSAWVIFDNQATRTWNRTIPSAQINVSPAGGPIPPAVSQIVTVIPPPPNTHSH